MIFHCTTRGLAGVRDIKQSDEKPCSQAGQKGPRCEAREKSMSGGVLRQYVGARRLSATKQMGLFQRSVQTLTSGVIYCLAH
jgi:hypothetical protein